MSTSELKLSDIQRMWREDSKIDIDKLDVESARIPQLHSKYYDMLIKFSLLKTQKEEDKKLLIKQKRDLHKGIYDDPDEIPNVIYKRNELSSAIESEESVSKLTQIIEYHNIIIDFLNDIIKMIHTRGFQIKNAIDYQKFTAGF